MAMEGRDERIGSAGVSTHHPNFVGLNFATPAHAVGQIEHLVDGPRGLDEEVGCLACGGERSHGLGRLHTHPIFDADSLGGSRTAIFVEAERTDRGAGFAGLVALDEAAHPEIHLVGMKHEGDDPVAQTAVVNLPGAIPL
jgi:hypothetical protein